MSVAPPLFVCVYCVNCIKFGQLILRITIKIDATRCQIFRLKCTKKSFSAGALPQTPLEELTALPRPPSWIKGGILLREREGYGKGREGKGRKGKGTQGRGGREKEGRGEEGTGREGTPQYFIAPPVPVF